MTRVIPLNIYKLEMKITNDLLIFFDTYQMNLEIRVSST
jgi:hypothetical protein